MHNLSQLFFKLATAIAVAVFAALPSFADGDPERGAVLAETCLGCHGIPGYQNAYPRYKVPKLAGQHEEYIVLALKGYQNRTRSHPTMWAQAQSLTDQDMRDIAAWFSSSAEMEAGQGRTSRGKAKTVVCTACHGATGVSPTGNWPNLAGQHEDYLREVITQYQDGRRSDPVMAGLVTTLTDQDIADIAAYYAAQPGLQTASQ